MNAYQSLTAFLAINRSAAADPTMSSAEPDSPIMSDTHDDDSGPTRTQGVAGTEELDENAPLRVGMTFNSIEEARKAIRGCIVDVVKSYKVLKADKRCWLLICRDRTCQARIRVNNGVKTVLTKLVGHSCQGHPHSMFKPANALPPWIVNRVTVHPSENGWNGNVDDDVTVIGPNGEETVHVNGVVSKSKMGNGVVKQGRGRPKDHMKHFKAALEAMDNSLKGEAMLAVFDSVADSESILKGIHDWMHRRIQAQRIGNGEGASDTTGGSI